MFAAADIWAQVLITLIGAIATIVSTIAGVAIVYLNLKAKLAENTRLTQQTAGRVEETHEQVVQTKTAMAKTEAVARTAAITNRAAAEELKAASEKIKSLMSGPPKEPSGDAA